MGTLSFDEYVIKSIISSNQYGIREVHNLESLKAIFLVREEYPAIQELIQSGNIEAIKGFPEKQPRTGEYLDVMLFNDQQENRYFVTVYDSNALEQDPQVVAIYPLK